MGNCSFGENGWFDAFCSGTNLLTFWSAISPGPDWSRREAVFWADFNELVDNFVKHFQLAIDSPGLQWFPLQLFRHHCYTTGVAVNIELMVRQKKQAPEWTTQFKQSDPQQQVVINGLPKKMGLNKGASGASSVFLITWWKTYSQSLFVGLINAAESFEEYVYLAHGIYIDVYPMNYREQDWLNLYGQTSVCLF